MTVVKNYTKIEKKYLKEYYGMVFFDKNIEAKFSVSYQTQIYTLTGPDTHTQTHIDKRPQTHMTYIPFTPFNFRPPLIFGRGWPKIRGAEKV